MAWRVVVVAAAGLMVTAGLGAAPASAADAYESKITGLPDRFQAGGQGGIMTVSVTRRAQGCVRIRALMLITLNGMVHGDLKVEVKTGNGWEISPISRANDNSLRAEDNWVDVQFLCAGQSRVLQHRITFLDGAPAGSALIDAVVSSMGDSTEVSRDKATRPVTASGGATPSATRTKASATPGNPAAASTAASTSASAEASREAEPAASSDGSVAAEPVERAADDTRLMSSAGLLTGGAVTLLGLGALLIVLFVVRRGRRGGPADPESGQAPGQP